MQAMNGLPIVIRSQRDQAGLWRGKKVPALKIMDDPHSPFTRAPPSSSLLGEREFMTTDTLPDLFFSCFHPFVLS
jgi:hypothetical protein